MSKPIDLIPNDEPEHSEMYKEAEKFMQLTLSELLGSSVSISKTTDYEIKTDQFSSVSRLDFIFKVNLKDFDAYKISEKLKDSFTSDFVQRKICTEILIAKTIYEELTIHADKINPFELNDIFKIFPRLSEIGVSTKEVLDFFYYRNQTAQVDLDLLFLIKSGELDLAISFACKSMDLKNAEFLQNEVVMYSEFARNNIRTFTALKTVFRDNNSGRCFNFTFWENNLILHAHNKALLSADSNLLEETIRNLLNLQAIFIHNDLHLRNIGIVEKSEDYNYELIFFDLVRSYAISPGQNVWVAIKSDFLMFCSGLEIAFKALVERHELQNEDAVHAINNLRIYKTGLEDLIVKNGFLPNESINKLGAFTKRIDSTIDMFQKFVETGEID